MTIKSIAAVGAIGVGLGLAGLIGSGTASAAPDPCTLTTAPFTPARTACVAQEQAATFGNTFNSIVNPAESLPVLIQGSPDDSDFGSLGLAHQGSTFVKSITGPGGFLDGPRNPDTDD